LKEMAKIKIKLVTKITLKKREVCRRMDRIEYPQNP